MSETRAIEFKHAVLPNGLTVIAEINPEAKSAALGYFVKTGSRDERPEESGVSHFLEHMVFKGTERRSAWEVNRAFDEMGAQYNAFTNEEHTVFYGAVLPEFAPQLLELFTDLMRPSLRPEDFETEKKVILEEIALYQDRPNFVLFERAQAHYYQGHPVGNSVLGSVDSISALTREMMAAYHARRYVPSNMVLAMTGRIDWDRALEQVAALTEGWAPGEAPRAHPPFTPRSGEAREPYDKAHRAYVALLAEGVPAADERRYAASVLASILGDDGNSRLYWALVDRGLAEAASAFHEEADGLGTFYVYLQTDPQRLDEVIAILQEELERLEREGVRAEEVTQAARKAATGLAFASETPLNRLFHLGLGFSYTGRYEPLSETSRKVARITAQEVNALLEARPFQRGFTFYLLPEEG
ncbi:M16 family metallopeptidase [Marinithermus hydrothermalis]|uniref:Processing peptidase n=1 Tax=Marinithermus hydrothermalis (strain DSM 14884 / JCM 11576 / T1) TaxID=869210 RepID=F2NP33_MARHT|nr:pitrilysin family protein [Marinithermus hydrothermalis]AEB11621.1 processing peptidase [Marinithermus hydrothermalis DSM 14884]